MVRLLNSTDGFFVKNGTKILEGSAEQATEARKHTMAYQIMTAHGQLVSDTNQLKIVFDALASHDITYVGIIQTVRAAQPDFDRFPVPYVLTNCHNSLCAVGGTTNEDDHVFGLSAAKKYGGIFVPPHISVIHQYMREAMAGCGKMILGSDSHTRYGPLGTMGFGEGGGELVKQILGRTYDIPVPEVVAVYLTGEPRPGVGPQDVALALIGAVFQEGTVKNKVLEFIGPGVENLSVEYRIGIDVMTTETACLSSIWTTDSKVEEYYALHGRSSEYKKMEPGEVAYYDGMIEIDLSKVVPMVAMPFHPSNVFTVEEIRGTKTDQAIIAGCAGGLYESICEAADILDKHSVNMTDAFSLSVYPASQPMYLTMVENGIAAKLIKAGVVLKTAFCGPCFGAGDVPKNKGLSIRHTTRNFPNREGSKPSLGQEASVALMDALSIAATAVNGGTLIGADQLLERRADIPKYYFNNVVYQNRVYEGFGKATPKEELTYGPGIRDWPEFKPMPENMLLLVASYITDEVTTTDELIPSGETSTFRSNPYALAEYTLSRKDPGYVERAKTLPRKEEALAALINGVKGTGPLAGGGADPHGLGLGSLIYANKPGDGSAREQAASCQRVLGGLANIAREYATKRYRSNLVNWGMLPLLAGEEVEFKSGDYVYLPGIRAAVSDGSREVTGYVVDLDEGSVREIVLGLDLSEDEAEILLAGCLINYYRG